MLKFCYEQLKAFKRGLEVCFSIQQILKIQEGGWGRRGGGGSSVRQRSVNANSKLNGDI